jgi:putative aldouronate transport system substrate-binding protein
MKKSMRVLTTLVALGVFMATFSACGKKENNTTKETDTTVSDVKAGNPTLPLVSKPTKLKLWMSTSNTIKNFNDSEFYKELGKRTGIEFDFISPAVGQEKEAFNLMIASNDLPDIVEMGSDSYPGGMDKAVSDGTFTKLNDLIKKYAPNYDKLINSDSEIKKACITDSGSIVGFFNAGIEAQPAWYGLVLRQDWLDELGLKTPVTYDDWYTMLKAFKEKKGAVAPMMLASSGFSSFDVFNAGYGVAQGFYRVDGKIKYGPLEKGYKEYLTMMNQWYKEGLIDKDFTTKKDFIPSATFTTTGKTGVWTDIYSLLSVDQAKAVATSPQYRAVGVPAPVLKEGDKLHIRQTNGKVGGTMWAISKNCKNPEVAVKLADYLFSPDGILLSNYGIKDKTYTIGSDGKPMFTEFMYKNPDGLNLYEAIQKYAKTGGAMEYHWERELVGQTQDCLDAQKLWGKNNDGSYVIPSAVALTSDEGSECSQIMGDIDTYVSEMNVKFILGQEPLSKYDNFVNTIKSMNIDQAIKLKQAALDRYNNRK